jgi:hypothetical protein
MCERDQEVEDFIRGLPRAITYSAIGAAILDRFGADRAWSRTRIFNFWCAEVETTKGRVTRLDLDPEQREFIEDRIGRSPDYGTAYILGLIDVPKISVLRGAPTGRGRGDYDPYANLGGR